MSKNTQMPNEAYTAHASVEVEKGDQLAIETYLVVYRNGVEVDRARLLPKEES